MEYGRRFKKAFEKARKSVDYWMEDLRLDFLNSLIATIEAKGISQKELGKRLGKSEAYISKVINSNSSNFTLKTMIQLCLALDSKISLKIEDIEP
ncbi:MAG: helix-turn-helix domain-containing protein, partial [Aminobacterium colombiense]|nr:helix-turn-helix domain-containing protein [Aminobacterium colombiense]